MPDDRFRDLGVPGPRAEGAAERLAGLDSEEEPPKQPAPARPSSRYTWLVGVIVIVIIVAAMLRLLPTGGAGVRGPAPGTRLPAFAAPLATGRLDGDANVRQQGSGGSESAGSRPACEVRGPDVLNVCDLRRKPLVLAFFFTRAADCEPLLDSIERLRREFPQVNFAGVVIREPRAKAAELVRENGWGFPVAVDRDGAVSNLYGIGGCPTTTLSYPGGEVRETRLGRLSEAELRSAIRALLRGKRGRSA